MLLDDLNFDEFDLDKYNIRNPNKATQTDIFNDSISSNYSSVAPSQSMNTPSEIERHEQQQRRETSTSTGESLDDVRYRTRMSISGDLATMARVGGNVIYYTGRYGSSLAWHTQQGIGQGISAAIDAYNWRNEDNDEDEQPEAPIDEEVYEQTQGPMRREASRSRSPEPEPEERASGSNGAIRLLRRGESRSRSETPPKKNNISNINDNKFSY